MNIIELYKTKYKTLVKVAAWKVGPFWAEDIVQESFEWDDERDDCLVMRLNLAMAQDAQTRVWNEATSCLLKERYYEVIDAEDIYKNI